MSDLKCFDWIKLKASTDTLQQITKISNTRQTQRMSITNQLALARVYSRNLTTAPACTLRPKSLASQLVRRIQPCDAVLEINDGFGVP